MHQDQNEDRVDIKEEMEDFESIGTPRQRRSQGQRRSLLDATHVKYLKQQCNKHNKIAHVKARREQVTETAMHLRTLLNLNYDHTLLKKGKEVLDMEIEEVVTNDTDLIEQPSYETEEP